MAFFLQISFIFDSFMVDFIEIEQSGYLGKSLG